jgi:ATP-binding cassette subfamily B protein
MKNTRDILRLYWSTAWRYPRYVIGIAIGIPLTVLIGQFLPPLILANVLNRLSRHNFQPHHLWASFGGDLVLYAGLLITTGLVGWRIVDHLNWKLEGNVERDLARRVFRHLLSQSANFHANRFGGSLVSQNSKLLGSYIRIADTTMYQVVPLISSLLWASLILARRAPLFVVILLGFSVVFMTVAMLVTRRVRRLGAEQAAAESAQTGRLADAVTNVMAIKSFSGSKFEQKEFGHITDNTFGKLLALMHGNQRQMVYFSSLMSTIQASSLVVAVIAVMVFNADIATMFLILSYASSITGNLFTFATNSLRNYNRSFGDAADMVEILQIEPEVKDPKRPEKSRISHGAISFNTVVFGHDGADEPIFNALTLDIKAGEKIGLVGHSGSGKTTLTRLLLRFSDIDGGEILIDGQNIANLTQDDLRASIAYVPQEPLLFHRSIRENIAYGKPGATDAEVFEAARKANAAEFIDTLPQGYDTLVGERGVKLSGGQRQRVVIARAILKDAPILVLDEATSALDSESELLIQSALQELMKQRTAIAIAHRLSTIQKMDRIIVLQEGKIVEQGSHAELVKKKGVYAQLWAHQSGGFIEE